VAPTLADVPTDLNSGDLAEVRRRVVEPVIRSLLREEELESLQLRLVPESEHDDARVWVHVIAAGESFEAPVVKVLNQFEDPVDAAAGLYDALWDWVVETKFAWGQDRRGRYEVPPRSMG
jgi:hypothetical protein